MILFLILLNQLIIIINVFLMYGKNVTSNLKFILVIQSKVLQKKIQKQKEENIVI